MDDGQLVTGVAVSAVGRLTGYWDVSASYQHLDARLRTQNAANDGNWLTLTPERAGSLWTTFQLPLSLRLGGGLRYTDQVYVNAANTIVVPAYTLADLLFEAPLGDRLMLRLNVYNVTDKRYVKSINNNGARYNPGAPRSILFTTGVRF